MSTQDRERWDARHARAGSDERPPNPEVMASIPADLRGRALDLASGSGRHALALAERELSVEAWDVSPVALALLQERATARRLSVHTRVVDVSGALPKAEPFDLVVVVDFLDRGLLSRLGELLAPGGIAIVSTFTEDWPEAHPSARFRLRRGELAAGLFGLSTLQSREAAGRATIAAIMA